MIDRFTVEVIDGKVSIRYQTGANDLFPVDITHDLDESDAMGLAMGKAIVTMLTQLVERRHFRGHGPN